MKKIGLLLIGVVLFGVIGSAVADIPALRGLYTIPLMKFYNIEINVRAVPPPLPETLKVRLESSTLHSDTGWLRMPTDCQVTFVNCPEHQDYKVSVRGDYPFGVRKTKTWSTENVRNNIEHTFTLP